MFGHAAIQPVIDAIIELAEHAAKEPFEFAVDDTDAVKADTKKLIGKDLAAAYKIVAKGERQDARRRRQGQGPGQVRQVGSQSHRHRRQQARRRIQGT